LDREKLGFYGLDAQTVGAYLRTSLQGTEATEITIDGEDLDVVVKTQNQQIDLPQELRNLSIINVRGQAVKLGQLAELTVTPALETIRHRDLERIVNVRADTEGVTANEVRSIFEEKLGSLNLPSDVRAEFGGEVEDIQQSFTELWYSMSLAVLLIFLILVLQFDSFSQPFIIVLTLPLAVIGVIAGTLLLGLSFGFGTFLGVVALAGIVVNDAIVLIDRINSNLRLRKMSVRESLVEAGTARLQPIIMTTLTTIAGVVPLAFVDEFWRGLSVAIAFGIAFATILTLGVVPILYQKFEAKKWLSKSA
jgi:HAE1 family hydrophobic/amphiphilic exporter-1